MTKSYTDLTCDVLNLFAAILADAAYRFPQLELEFSRDWLRLTRLVRQRGLPFLLVDLPALLKHLDRCLGEGTYSNPHLPGSSQVSKGVVIPKLFRGLYQLVFEPNGCLKENFDVEGLFFLRQLYAGGKRAPLDPSDRAVHIAMDGFLRVDSTLPETSEFWRNPGNPCNPGTTFQFCYGPKAEGVESLLVILDRISGLISSSLGIFDPLQARFKHGPGVVSDMHSSENRYRFDSWNSMLESGFPYADVCFANHRCWVKKGRKAITHMGETVSPSQMAAVRKTFEKPRLIAAEPRSNLWCQQALRHHMYTEVAGSWIDRFIRFTDQSRNQALARVGSTDGSLATIDLSEASDRVSCTFVECLFRANHSLLRALRACRTQSVVVPINGISLEVVLRKYSTMGNATTFPVESLAFLAVTLAACCWTYGWEPSLRNIQQLEGKVSVFGDDIVCPTEVAGILTRLLEVLDFKVNTAKTHVTGRFRESCGVDCFAGQTITPAYWKGPCQESPESIAGALDVSNNFYGKFLLRTAGYIQSTIPRKFRFPVVPFDSGAVGLRSFVWNPECLHSSFRSRWNRDLQKAQWQTLFFSTKVNRTEMTDESGLLQFFTEQPEPHVMWSSGVRTRARLRIRRGWRGIEDIISPSTLGQTLLPASFQRMA